MVLTLLSCAARPEITAKQVENDLVGRTVGEGLSAESFGKTAFGNTVIKRITLVEAKYDSNRAAIVAEVESEWQPPPMPTFAPVPTLPAPSWPPGVSPPPTWVPPPTTFPSPPAFLLKGYRKSGRLRLHYEWVAKQWNLTTVDNLSYKRQQ